MKSTTIFCAALAIALSAQLIMANNSTNEDVQVSEPVQVTETDPNNGMYFNSKNVVDNVRYGTKTDGMFYLIYDDVDAEHYYEAIRVTEETYLKVVRALDSKMELSGNLFAVDQMDFVEYELRTEEE